MQVKVEEVQNIVNNQAKTKFDIPINIIDE